MVQHLLGKLPVVCQNPLDIILHLESKGKQENQIVALKSTKSK